MTICKELVAKKVHPRGLRQVRNIAKTLEEIFELSSSMEETIGGYQIRLFKNPEIPLTEQSFRFLNVSVDVFGVYVAKASFGTCYPVKVTAKKGDRKNLIEAVNRMNHGRLKPIPKNEAIIKWQKKYLLQLIQESLVELEFHNKMMVDEFLLWKHRQLDLLSDSKRGLLIRLKELEKEGLIEMMEEGRNKERWIKVK